MPPIKLPPTPSSAYNENRPANVLLLAQVRELEKAVRAAGRRVHGSNPKTEAEVAAYVRLLNRALHNQVLLPALKRRPLRAPGQGGAVAKPRKRRATRSSAKAGAAPNAGRVRAIKKKTPKQGRTR
jgi:hypothetical protein